MSDHSEKLGGIDFARQAEQSHPGLLREFWDFLRYNKKWWLMPIVIWFIILGVLVFASSSSVAPFIYTIF